MKNVTYINAGAGSGKTYTLSHKLTDLIKEGINPEQVILTTFTTKAASEFKVEAKKVLFEEGLYDEAVRLEHALIGTVHSVCQQLISKYWFVLGLSPNMGVMSEEDEKFYISQSLSELPTDKELKMLHQFCIEFNVQLLKDFIPQGLNFDFWQDDLKKIIGFATNYEIESFDHSCEESISFIRRFVKKDKKIQITDNEVEQVLAEAYTSVKNNKRMTTKEERYKIFEQIKRGNKHRSFAWYAKIMNEINPKWGPTCALVIERLISLWNLEEVYLTQEKYIRLLFDLAQRWKEQFAQFKREKNLLDYNDMEKYMHLLMQKKEIASEISKSYRYLFVDEFQDSSPIQVKIFDALSELMEHSYWVGDYKQAIYGFRGSDTALTKAVVDIIGASQSSGCDTCTLDTSRRSLPDIVELNNRVFKETFKGILPEENIVLKEWKKNEHGVDSLRYIRTDKNVTVADHVAKLLHDGACPNEIGVIARKNTDLDAVAKALAKWGIPVSRADLSVVDTRTYILVTSLLRMVSNADDSLAKATVAMLVEEDFSTKQLIEKRILNLSDEELHETDFLSDVLLIQQLLTIRPKLQQQSVAAMIESMIIELNLYDIIKQLEVGAQTGDTVLQTLINTGKSYEEHCVQMNLPATIEGFIAYFKALDPKGQGDPKGVQLHTYHSSKGLQWKYVVLMSLQKVTSDESTVTSRNIYGVHAYRLEQPGVANLYPEACIRLIPWIFGTSRKVPETILNEIKKLEMFHKAVENFVSEENRVLYVGMTRPVEVLILDLKSSKQGCLRWFTTEGLQHVASSQPKGTEDILGVEMPFTDYSVTGEEMEQMEDGLPGLEDGNNSRLRISAPSFESLASRYLSPSKAQGMSSVVAHYDFGTRISLDNQPKDMAIVGNCIHQIFATIEELNVMNQDVRKKLIDSYELSTVLTSTDEIENAWKNLVHFMTEKYGAAIRTYHERPFVYDKDGQRYTGSIDLVWKTLQGDILIDYKTCPMGEKAILNPKSEHFVGLYGGQLNVYASALEAAGEKVIAHYIYYPVSGLLVELSSSHLMEQK